MVTQLTHACTCHPVSICKRLIISETMIPLTWPFYQMRKIAGCAKRREFRVRFRCHRPKWKPLVGDAGMHHGTCVAHVSRCMSGLLTRGGGENVPDIPGARTTDNLRIWQEPQGNTNINLCIGSVQTTMHEYNLLIWLRRNVQIIYLS